MTNPNYKATYIWSYPMTEHITIRATVYVLESGGKRLELDRIDKRIHLVDGKLIQVVGGITTWLEALHEITKFLTLFAWDYKGSGEEKFIGRTLPNGTYLAENYLSGFKDMRTPWVDTKVWHKYVIDNYT